MKDDSVGEEEQSVTAAERVYRILRKKILLNEFVPGKRLPRRKLAEMTGVSQIPVLEAMKRLEQEGLIEYKPRWGCVVTLPSVEKIKDLYALREAIECQVVRILALNITEGQLDALTQLAADLDELRESAAGNEIVSDLHNKLHVTMAEFTGFSSLVSPLRRVNLFWLLYKSVESGRGNVAYPKGWHTRLVDAIRGGDPDAAERMMREHIHKAYTTLLESMEKADAD